MAKGKDDAEQMDDMGPDDMTALPSLRDDMANDQPMLADEQRAADMRKGFEEENRKLDETRQRSQDFRQQAENPNPDAMKLFLVIPGDMNEPPFHFHNTPDQVLVAAETPEYALRLASATHGPVWEDDSRVRVREVKFSGPQVLNNDAWKAIARQLLAEPSE